MEKSARVAPQQHLQPLWRKHDVTDVVVRFLDLKSISRLPTISRFFAADHPRLLVSLIRGEKDAKRRLMDALADGGYDSARLCERWENGLANWERRESVPYEHPAFTAEVHDDDLESYLVLSTPPGFFSHANGLARRVGGQRNRVRRLKMRCRFEEGNGGGCLLLWSIQDRDRTPEAWDRDNFRDESQLCRLYFKPDGPGITSLVYINDNISDLTPYDSRNYNLTLVADAQPGQWYSVVVDFDWDTSTVSIEVDGGLTMCDTSDGITFNRFAFGGIFLNNYSSFTAHFADIEVEYSVASTSFPFEDCRDVSDQVSDDSDDDSDDIDDDSAPDSDEA